MEAAWRAAYLGVILPAARILLALGALVDSKLAAFRQARRYWRELLEADLARRPDVPAGDALWVHAASAGEFLQARTLLAALRAAYPAAPLVYTFTSPSAAPLLERFRGADLVAPLPLDTPANARDWLDRVRPAALALVDAELWPSFLRECLRRRIHTALVSARLGGRSRRERFPARWFYRRLYRGLDVVCCVDEASAERFRAAGLPTARVRVAGDLRIDETLRRAAGTAAGLELPLPAILPAVVAGSTWPDDEAVLLPALEILRDLGVFFSLVIAPHEVHEKRLGELETALDAAGFTPVRWSRLPLGVPDAGGAEGGGGSWWEESAPAGRLPRLGTAGLDPAAAEPAADALLVDRVGPLHRLYARAAVAYVGGGFRGALHNVMEPAVFGVPVLTGPRTERSWVAAEMIRACGLFPVADREACVAALQHLLAGDAAAAAGARAREILLAHAGATGRILAALREAEWPPQEEAGAGTSGRNSSGGTRST